MKLSRVFEDAMDVYTNGKLAEQSFKSEISKLRNKNGSNNEDDLGDQKRDFLRVLFSFNIMILP